MAEREVQMSEKYTSVERTLIEEDARKGRYAFPFTINATDYPCTGMTFRQYAAVAAMQGILANPTPQSAEAPSAEVAVMAVGCADAVIAELEKS